MSTHTMHMSAYDTDPDAQGIDPWKAYQSSLERGEPPSTGDPRYRNPELAPFYRGREARLNRAIIKILAEKPGQNIYRIWKLVSEFRELEELSYTTVLRRVKALSEDSDEPGWWIGSDELRGSERNPNMRTKLYRLKLQGVLTCLALWYDDKSAKTIFSDLKKNYDLYFPIYFANRVDHPFAEEWLLKGIGESLRNMSFAITEKSWQYTIPEIFMCLWIKKREMQKSGKDIRNLGITKDVVMKFINDTRNLPQLGWNKVAELFDAYPETYDLATELVAPNSLGSTIPPSPKRQRPSHPTDKLAKALKES